MKEKSWFKVDKEGLMKLIDERGKAAALYELVQNGWDTNANNISVQLEKIAGRPFANLVVIDDDPDGFHDLSHAYTLFAESPKKSDPTQRGRFNMGEILVLALCRSARVESTSGTVIFDENGMSRSRKKTAKGSVFQAIIRMNKAEYDEVCQAMFRLIPPDGKKTLFNGEQILPFADCVTVFEATLPTVVSDSEGTLRKTHRKCEIEILKAEGPGWVYEMGIPVVETGDQYHVNVKQKVPLAWDRANVTPAYLRLLRSLTLNATSKLLTKEEACANWVTNALSDNNVDPAAVIDVIDIRFGKKRVIYDPTDKEASEKAQGQGYTVLYGGSLSKAVWEVVRSTGAALPAGRVMPTPRLYTNDPNAPVRKEILREDWTEGMREVEEITRWFAKELGISDDLLVMFALPTGPMSRKVVASWNGSFEWNVTCLSRKWFNNWMDHFEQVLDTIIHEFSHQDVSNHRDEKFYRACTRNGANGMLLMLTHGKRMPHYKKLMKHLEQRKDTD